MKDFQYELGKLCLMNGQPGNPPFGLMKQLQSIQKKYPQLEDLTSRMVELLRPYEKWEKPNAKTKTGFPKLKGSKEYTKLYNRLWDEMPNINTN